MADQFGKPAGLETVEIDPTTGMIANEFCPQRQKVALPSSLMPGICYLHQGQVASDFPEIDSDIGEGAGQILEDDLRDKDEQPVPITEEGQLPVSFPLPKPPPPNRRYP